MWQKDIIPLTKTCPFRINFRVDDKISIFTHPVFDLAFRHVQAHTIKFWSRLVNSKSYLPSLTTKAYESVCTIANAYNYEHLSQIMDDKDQKEIISTKVDIS